MLLLLKQIKFKFEKALIKYIQVQRNGIVPRGHFRLPGHGKQGQDLADQAPITRRPFVLARVPGSIVGNSPC